MKPTVLIIDDDVKLLELLKNYLGKFDLKTVSATHPKEGMALLYQVKPDLIILDVMLPDQNGFETLKAIRKESEIPVIMLTARGEVTDRIVGLELGADDYLPKPFEPRELLVRIQTVLRRSSSDNKDIRHLYGGLEVDTVKRTAYLKKKELDLSTAEFDILELFILHPGRTFNRDEIIDRLKGTDWAAFHRSVDVLISRLRQKLEDDPKNPAYIKTIWGTGYRFIASRGPF